MSSRFGSSKKDDYPANVISLVTSCLGLQEEEEEEEPQTACRMSITWESHMADTVPIWDANLYPINITGSSFTK